MILRPLNRHMIGIYLKDRLVQNDLSQLAASRLLEISNTYFCKLCNGEARLSPEVARKLNTILIDGKYLYLCQALSEYSLSAPEIQTRIEESV